MSAERVRSAGFNCRHHFELAQADMPRIDPPPRRTMGSKDISDLQLWPGHAPRASLQPAFEGLILQVLEVLEWADGVADGFGGDMRIPRRRTEFGMA